MYINIYIAILIISSIITVSLGIYALWKIKEFYALCYAFLMFAISFFSAGYAYELTCSNLHAIMWAIRIEYLGIPFISAFWLMFAMEYSGNRKKGFYPYLFIMPVVTLILVNTYPSQKFYYAGLDVAMIDGRAMLQLTKGPWYVVHMIYNHCMLAVGNIVFLRMALGNREALKSQGFICFVASLIPWLGNALYVLGFTPKGLDITPLSISLTGPLFVFAMTQFRLFSVTPIALRYIFEHMTDPVFVMDSRNILVNLNESARSFVNENKKGLIETPLSELLRAYPPVSEEITTERYGPGEIIHMGVKGKEYYNSRFSEIYTDREKLAGRILALQNVTAEKNLILALDKQATTDYLTGISNRRNFYQQAKIELDKTRRYNRDLSLLSLDLDHFKKINDQYGHLAGDAVLVEVVNGIKQNLRTFDLFARFGGEEFILLLPETDSKMAKAVGDKICGLVEDLTISYEGEKISVTLSVGAFAFNGSQQGLTLDDAISLADQALYKAKESGRNQVWIS